MSRSCEKICMRTGAETCFGEARHKVIPDTAGLLRKMRKKYRKEREK